MAEDVVYLNRKKDSDAVTTAAGVNALSTTIGSVSEVITEFSRTAISSPLMACILSLAAADILYKLGAITPVTKTLIQAIVVTAAGITLTGDVLNIIGEVESDLSKLLGGISQTTGSTAPADLLHSSVTTTVNGGGTSVQDLVALLPALIAAIPK